jgi:phage baseplate assembly protein W
MAERSFLGVGWRFPVALTRPAPTPAGAGPVAEARRVEVSAYERSIEESIRIVLGTLPGERVMRPTFGCDLNRLAFAPNNTSTAGLAIFHVREALERWEPRIELLGVDAGPDPASGDTLLIAIDYRVVAINMTRNLVYPFYLGRE